MADTKISALTALAAADVDTAADVLPIVDTGATATKKITVDNLRTAIGPKADAVQATTSGTAIDFTSIPSWVKRITIGFAAISTSGSSNPMVQIGDSGGIETSGYAGSARTSTTNVLFTTGFGLLASTAATTVSNGIAVLILIDPSTNTWCFSSVLGHSDAAQTSSGGGSKALSATLDRVRITTVNGSDTFDAGSVNILME